ncbi:unnamed protein product [Cuscuta campestris]|uniref:NAC domain-containing protein n=1 Tax=Cuscuta campestris TaxID=132261 RepID=A0A484N2G2_9ASTE|nr:unnamed protein product [Cuscuta campestris]
MEDDQRRKEGEESGGAVLPGFRFHPTDEELVGFYLKKKVLDKPLSIELIKQLDIYKYDPWDLPKLAGTGEKEWYFYCPRDRKYRNSVRPNRVTKAGFWKATGTDRPIYSSSDDSKCIGLKKSLVFYRGRAAKGSKTDWMMHEFRLPPLSGDLPSHKREAWAICRIFKKANPNVTRALSQQWAAFSPATPQNTLHELQTLEDHNNNINHDDDPPHHKNTPPSTLLFHCATTNTGFKCSPEIPVAAVPAHPLPHDGPSSAASYSALFHSSPFTHYFNNQTLPSYPITQTTNDPSSLFLELAASHACGGGMIGSQLPVAVPPENDVAEGKMPVAAGKEPSSPNIIDESIRFSFNGFPLNENNNNVWKSSSLAWDYPSPCPSEISSGSYSTNTSSTFNLLL